VLVTVDTVRPDPSAAHSTVAIGEGINEDGDRITFVGEARLMSAIAQDLGGDEPIEVELESYQIIGREPA
jgi:hypothetical protein